MGQKRVVVTGATSFLGNAVVGGLLDNNYEVFSVVRPNSQNIQNIILHDNNTIIYKDLSDISEIYQEIGKADVFIHFGWDGQGSAGRLDKQIQRQNIENAIEALNTAKLLGCTAFFFPGSQAEYGIHEEAVDEDSECRPVSEYGKAKLEFGETAEKLCGDGTMQFIHLRIFSIYGSKDHPWTLVKSCIRSFEEGEEIQLGQCTQLWNYLYIFDFVDLMVRLVDTRILEQTCILNVGGQETRPLREFVQMIYGLTKRKGTYIFGDRLPNAEGMASLNPDITKLKRLTGWSPKVGFEDGIRDMIESYRENRKNG